MDADSADGLLVMPLDGPIQANVTLPGSKSITNRALVCAALAEGESTLVGIFRGYENDLAGP